MRAQKKADPTEVESAVEIIETSLKVQSSFTIKGWFFKQNKPVFQRKALSH